jgi:hypothetical protein
VKGGDVTLVQVRADSSVPRAQPGSLEPVSMTDRQVPASVRCWLAKAGILDRVAHGVYRLAGGAAARLPRSSRGVAPACSAGSGLGANIGAGRRIPPFSRGVVRSWPPGYGPARVHAARAAAISPTGRPASPPGGPAMTAPARSRTPWRPMPQFRAQAGRWPWALSLAPRNSWRPASIPVDRGGESAGRTLLRETREAARSAPGRIPASATGSRSYGSLGAFRRALTDKLRNLAAGSRWTLQQLPAADGVRPAAGAPLPRRRGLDHQRRLNGRRPAVGHPT